MSNDGFWDKVFSEGQEGSYSRIEMPDLQDPVLQAALAHFGNMEDKIVVDLGCGRGATSLFFAHLGAKVISIDSSEVAIANLSAYCQENGITNISPIKMSALEISKLGEVDFVFGSMILHHIEPFREFSKSLRDVIKPGGRGFFWENNARSKIMLWFREHVVGKFWIPKYGDPDEFPLMPSEIDEMRNYFDVEIEYPELLYFQMIPFYFFRSRFNAPFKFFDTFFFRYPEIRKHSYRQYVILTARPESQ